MTPRAGRAVAAAWQRAPTALTRIGEHIEGEAEARAGRLAMLRARELKPRAISSRRLAWTLDDSVTRIEGSRTPRANRLYFHRYSSCESVPHAAGGADVVEGGSPILVPSAYVLDRRQRSNACSRLLDYPGQMSQSSRYPSGLLAFSSKMLHPAHSAGRFSGPTFSGSRASLPERRSPRARHHIAPRWLGWRR